MVSSIFSCLSKPKTLATPKVHEVIKQQELIVDKNAKQTAWKTASQFLTKLNRPLNIIHSNVLLGIYPKELKTFVHIKTCTQIFIAALFIISQNRKQQRYPLVGE